MKIKVQKSDQKSESKTARPAKSTSKKPVPQVRDVALSVVEQGLKKPAKPRPERPAPTAPPPSESHKPIPRPRTTEDPRDKRPVRPAGLPGRPAEPEHTPTSVRLFFALKVPASVAGRLAEAQRKLKGNWRNVRPDQMHVTLTYMPAVPTEKIDVVKQLGLRLLSDLPPLNIKLRGTGYFPNEGSPRVWFVKVEAAGLDELAENLRQGVSALGIETDDLAFKAHITLARKKGPAPRVPPQLFDLGWTATGAALYRSHLQKTGPIYEIQSTFRFLAQPPADVSPSAPPLPHSEPNTAHPTPDTVLDTVPDTVPDNRPDTVQDTAKEQP